MAGVDIRTIQELMGHRTLALTLRYEPSRRPTRSTPCPGWGGINPAPLPAPAPRASQTVPPATRAQPSRLSAKNGTGGALDRTGDLGIMSPFEHKPDEPG